jgi:hypothetical protein
VKTHICQVDTIFNSAFGLRPPFVVPFRFIEVSRDRARSISAWANIQFGLISHGRSGMKKNAQVATGKLMTASMMKIQRHPGRPEENRQRG